MTFSNLMNTGRGRNGFFQALTFTLLLVAFACKPALAGPAVPITQCGTVISQPGHYIVANDLTCGVTPVSPINTSMPMSSIMTTATTLLASHSSSSADGIVIISDNVDLTLDGHIITGDSSINSFGISVGVGVAGGNSHVHITGLGIIQGFGAAVVFEQVSRSSVSDLFPQNNFVTFAIVAGDCGPACPSTKNDFQGNFAFSTAVAFFLQGANDNTVRDSTINGDGVGILLADGTGNDLRGNVIGDNSGVGILIGSGATDNDITNNTAQNNAAGDLEDDNANCDSNTWKHNTFGTANQTCIH